jgi:hypothetical protein
MRGVIKGVLAEELAHSLQMKRNYEQALRLLPQGALSVRKIRGREYYYLAHRVGKKVKFDYLGRIPKPEIKKYQAAKLSRAKYRKQLAQVNKQIRYLRSALRGKEPI